MIRRVLAILLVVSICSVLIFSDLQLSIVVYADGENWLTGWTYRKSHEIANSTGAGTNYQVRIIVVNGSDSDSGDTVYIDNKTRSDFGDVRFTDNDGSTELHYWMELVFSGINATFWVEVADDLSSANQTIYLYYGKSDATTTSNGANTFLFFDDFDGSSLNTDRWDLNKVGSITYSVANSKLHITDASKSGGDWWIYDNTDTGSQHQAKWTPTTGFAVRWKQQIFDTVSTYMGMVGFGIVGTDNKVSCYTMQDDGNAGGVSIDRKVSGYYPFVEATKVSSSATITSGDNRIFETRRIGTSITLHDETANENMVSGTSSDISKVAIAVGAYGGYSFLDYVDVFFVMIRNYVYPEPAHGDWGSEQESYQVTVTFYVYPDGTPSYLNVNESRITSGEAREYDKNTILELEAYPISSSFLFFDYDGIINSSNPVYLTVTSNMITNCHFGAAAEVASAGGGMLLVGIMFGFIFGLLSVGIAVRRKESRKRS